MVITFAQYSILMATCKGATRCEVQQKTTFDATLVKYHLSGLIQHDLLHQEYSSLIGEDIFELTELGGHCLDEYERANPVLVIRTLSPD